MVFYRGAAVDQPRVCCRALELLPAGVAQPAATAAPRARRR
eukprot:COSAG01_NODE_3817_length_5669_cov_3.770916_6_plen_40_part_01